MRKKRPGTYAPLATHYYDDPKIIEAGEEAELLYVRMLAFASGQPEMEGVVPDRIARQRLAPTGSATGKGTGSATGSDTGNILETLQNVGLIAREGDGWRITSWLRWNRSAADIERDRADDRRRKNALTRSGTGKGTGSRTGKGTGVGTGSGTDSGNTSGSQSGAPDEQMNRYNPLTSFGGAGGGDGDAARVDRTPATVVADAPTQTTKAKRGTRLPEGWTPERSQANLRAEHDSGLTPDELSGQLERFRDHWIAQPGSKGTKLDWQATWRNWVRRAAEIAPRTRQSETDAWYARAKARASNPNPLLSLLADDASPSNDPGRPAMPPRSA